MTDLVFPSSPSDNDRYAGFTYDATDGIWRVNKELVTGSPVASGGTEVVAGGYRYHTFLSNGTLTVTSGGDCEVLMVGGGGGGGTGVSGNEGGGGGGAGGLIFQTVTLTATNYPIVIGPGGTSGNSGTDTTGFGLTAYGGGRGGNAPAGSGATGGCGGGPAGIGSNNNRRYGAASIQTPGFGNEGGPSGNVDTADPNESAGGGGGAGSIGGPGGSLKNPSGGGNGGPGFYLGDWASATSTGDSGYYAGGGGGGMRNVGDQGIGGVGGGGNGGTGGTDGFDATANTGGGGGGAGGFSGNNGGTGGSGIVIVRYAI